MMYIVLSRNPHEITPLYDWIKDVAQNTAVVTQMEHKYTYEPFFNVIGLDNYDNIYEKINAIESINNYNEIVSIAALSEFDLEDAARCRKRFNIPGQSLTSAMAFRNKLLMKKYVSDAGVPVANYKCVKSIENIVEFGKLYGFPIIVKPIDGGGSANTFKLKSEEEIFSILSLNSNSVYLCETYINGGMIHCDGIYEDGEIKLLSISEYLGFCLSYQSEGALASYQISPQSQKWIRGERMLKKVLSALPCPEVMGFHAEFFVVEDEDLIFCEIASRIGGARIIDTVELSHQTSMPKYWLRKQLKLQNAMIETHNSKDVFGWALIPPKEGVLKQVPENPPFNWIYGYKKHFDVSMVTNRAQTSVDSIVSYIVHAKSTQDVRNRLEESINWFYQNIKYELL